MITEQITRLQNAKEAIKASLEAKGVVVDATAKLDTYASIIDGLSTGGGGGEDPRYEKLANAVTVNGKSLGYAFYYNQYYTSSADRVAIDLSCLDTSMVEDFRNCFRYCYATSINCAGWDVTKTTGSSKTSAVFGGANATNIDITGWNTAGWTDFTGMFAYCSNLTRVEGEIDLSNMIYGNLYQQPGGLLSTDPAGFFFQCNNLEYIKLKNIFKNRGMSNNSGYRIDISHTKINDECLIYMIDNLPDLYAKGLTDTSNLTLKLPATNTLTAEQVQVALDKGWTVLNTTY